MRRISSFSTSVAGSLAAWLVPIGGFLASLRSASLPVAGSLTFSSDLIHVVIFLDLLINFINHILDGLNSGLEEVIWAIDDMLK